MSKLSRTQITQNFKGQYYHFQLWSDINRNFMGLKLFLSSGPAKTVDSVLVNFVSTEPSEACLHDSLKNPLVGILYVVLFVQ